MAKYCLTCSKGLGQLNDFLVYPYLVSDDEKVEVKKDDIITIYAWGECDFCGFHLFDVNGRKVCFDSSKDWHGSIDEGCEYCFQWLDNQENHVGDSTEQ